MKAKIIPNLIFLSLFLIFLSSCEDTTYREYKGNAPIYMTYEELRKSVTDEPGTDLKNPGKIYFKDGFIFIIEELKGIHVFDNADPANPVQKTFVKVPGIMDMAISGNILYADSFVDLVILDLQDLDNIHETGRLTDILPYTIPPTGNEFPKAFVDKDKGLVVDWELTTIKERVYNNPIVYPVFMTDMNLKDGAFYSTSGSSSISSGGVGIGGSMARFGLKGNVLYILDNNNLRVLDINVKSNPVKLFDLSPGWGIETMFLTQNNMFLGTTTGMIIYDITDPASPVRKSTYNHIRSCDPVVVDDTVAYITLRTGTNCGGSVNSLDVVNIRNISSPALVASYPMTNPHGLGKDGNLLFICDGSAGLKVYDASNPRTVSSHLIYAYPGIKTFDVIPVGDVLVMIGDDGLYQYNYSNIQNISLISTIQVTEK